MRAPRALGFSSGKPKQPGKLKRLGRKTRVWHVAEVLAGMTDGPAIGEPIGEPESE